jgi:hypothetical protein
MHQPDHFRCRVLLIGTRRAYKTGKLEQCKPSQYVRGEKGEARACSTKATPAKLPPINQGLQAAGGTRRAVAADAPSAAGETSSDIQR